MFAYKGLLDEYSNITVTDALVDKYCADGARIEYIRNLGVNHEEEGQLVAMGAFAWLNDRMNGVEVPEGCNYAKEAAKGLSPKALRRRQGRQVETSPFHLLVFDGKWLSPR
ncbi:MAG: hypothetical protein Q9162_005831 [Coniocarpon cinnabarinum]